MQKLQPFKQDFGRINLIEASAGTGKTYHITWLYLRYLMEEGLSVQEILVVTFTRAASKELKDRLLSRIQQSIQSLKTDEKEDDHFLHELHHWVERKEFNKTEIISKLKYALHNFDRAQVFTIHSFCQSVYRELVFETGGQYDAELVEDDHDLFQEVADDFWRTLNQKNTGENDLLNEYILQAYGDPEKLSKGFYDHTGKPYLQITPSDLSLNSFKEALESYKTSFEVLKQCWQKQRDEIVGLLDPTMLKYYKGNIESRVADLEDWINKFLPDFLPDKLKYFQQSYISDEHNHKKAAIKKGRSAPVHAFFEQVDEIIPIYEELQSQKGAVVAYILHHLVKKFNQKKQEQRVFSYDDILIRLQQTLDDSDKGARLASKLRDKYPLALVDEFQDTDPIQYAIFRKIYATGNGTARLFMVGDPKQAIYGFRGADIFAYLHARNDAREENRFKLSHNYRSVPMLLKGINQLFEHVQNPFILSQISFQSMHPGKSESAYEPLLIEDIEVRQQAPLQLWDLNPMIEENKPKKEVLTRCVENAVADEILWLIRKGKTGEATIGKKNLRAGDITILVRTNEQGRTMREALFSRGIKSVLVTKESVFHSDEAYELELLLRAVAAPGNEQAISAALATRLLGVSGEELLRLQQDEQAWSNEVQQFARWNTQWNERGFAFVFQAMLREKEITVRLMELRDGERRITDLIHLGELMQSYAHKRHSGSIALIKWLAQKRRQEDSKNEEEQLRLESDEELVHITTLHKSKGLEFPVVFCPYMWQGEQLKKSLDTFTYHATSEDGQAMLDVGSEESIQKEHLFQNYRESLAEEMRLAYVGMTRACQRCYVPWIYFKGRSEFSPLGALLMGPEAAIAHICSKLGMKCDKTSMPHGKAIEALKKKTDPDVINVVYKTQQAIPVDANIEKREPRLEARTWKRPAMYLPSEQIASFSYLSRQQVDDAEAPDYDQWDARPQTTPLQEGNLTMMNFPRGPEPGTCIHAIFEQLDFLQPVASQTNRKIISQIIDYHDIAPKWIPVLRGCIETVLHKSLLANVSESKMSDLSPKDELREMEFYFPIAHTRTADLVEIIRGKPSTLSMQAHAGFMKGYIDLTLNFGGRYYVLDYKSNHLGNSPENYRQAALKHQMQEHLYDLQYHIYCVCLHRMLQNTLPDYDYKKHFGGAIYLFLRGINAQPDNFNGIYVDRPSQAILKQLDQYLQRGGMQ